jgi:hypothetical protein
MSQLAHRLLPSPRVALKQPIKVARQISGRRSIRTNSGWELMRINTDGKTSNCFDCNSFFNTFSHSAISSNTEKSSNRLQMKRTTRGSSLRLTHSDRAKASFSIE